jgi:hypothetical protein
VTGTLPLALAAGLYIWQALNYVFTGQYGMAVAFVAYALANLGFIAAAHRW